MKREQIFKNALTVCMGLLNSDAAFKFEEYLTNQIEEVSHILTNCELTDKDRKSLNVELITLGQLLTAVEQNV